MEKSRSGHRLTVRDIRAELERMLGHTVAKSTIYRMLKRHQWRKLVPRPQHPNRTKEEQEQFKKPSAKKLFYIWPIALRRITERC
jgi:Winged helix-turn helix